MQLACPNLKVLMPNEVLEIIDLCLQIFPSKRPSASTIFNLLTNIVGNSTNTVTQINSGLNEPLNYLKGKCLNLVYNY